MQTDGPLPPPGLTASSTTMERLPPVEPIRTFSNIQPQCIGSPILGAPTCDLGTSPLSVARLERFPGREPPEGLWHWRARVWEGVRTILVLMVGGIQGDGSGKYISNSTQLCAVDTSNVPYMGRPPSLQ